MPSTIRPEILQRVILTKSLVQTARPLMTGGLQREAISIGIIMLQDAVELALGAVADHLNAAVKEKTTFMEYFGLIKDADPQKREVPYRAQCNNLNRVRNDLKHHGIMPDPGYAANFLPLVEDLLVHLTKTYLGVDFAEASLISLVNNPEVKRILEEAVENFDRGDYETCLRLLAWAMYEVHENQSIPWFPAPESQSPFLWTRSFRIDDTVRLLEHGVDPYRYYRFKNLTPRLGKAQEGDRLVFHWNKEFGHPANWTRQNALFCLDVAIDASIKFQRPGSDNYRLVDYMEVYEDVVTAETGDAIFYGESLHARSKSLLFPDAGKPRTEIFRLGQGQSIVGYAMSDPERPEELSVISLAFGERRLGYVCSESVTVERRQRMPS